MAAPERLAVRNGVVVLETGERDEEVAAFARELAARCGADVVTTRYAARAAATPDALVCVAVGRKGLRFPPPGRNPVLVLGPRCRPGWRDGGEILVGLDGSRRAEAVLLAAGSWADTLGVGLLLASVVTPSRPADLASPTYCPDVLENGYLGRVAASARGHGRSVNWEVLHGDPATALVAHADHAGCAMVACNTHGASTVAHAPLGRLPARVVLASPVPVLLTRHVAPLPSPPRPHRTGPAPQVRPLARAPVHRAPTTLADAARTYQARSPARRHADVPPVAVPWRRLIAWASPPALVALALVAVFLHLPYYAVKGRTVPARQMLSVTAVAGDEGSILVPVVDTHSLTALGALRAWFDPAAEVRERHPYGVAVAWREHVNRELMVASRTTAVQLAAARLGVPASSLRTAGDPGGVGGPSGGLAFALHVLDALSPGDLTGGQVVAATGALDRRGRVYAVSGIRHKAMAARRAGADILLVPRANHAEAVSAAPGLRIVPVATLDEAIAVLAAGGPR